ncbi:ubiquinone biosynthesis protein [Oscillatoria sp. FACHB-1407]|uniref:Coq4 family protein n=1 Tax=Oscillatoria sp. FACHB-1407 TaxID=2692847 RepID=UPI001688A9C5|nr:Coq4 family protein [Oscillatoria sp. FACHB-1407]MBD2463679.1 ubiquinone biosynthesis protein [Oscillatoria sp. FACHB-1407]
MQLIHSTNSNISVTTDPKQNQNPILKGLKSFLAKVLIVKSFTSMLFGDNSLKTVGELADGLLETPAYALMAHHLNQDPDCAVLIRDRYIPPVHDLDRLLTYPSDSLGYIYAAYLKKTGFDPNLHAGMTTESDAKYVELRLSQTHDLWHIITGFDTSEIGEIGLQAFHLPQFPYPLGTMLIANSLISATLMAPETLPQLLGAIAQGLQMGKTAKPLFAQKWEEGWEKPLAQWQAELNIQPIQN